MPETPGQPSSNGATQQGRSTKAILALALAYKLVFFSLAFLSFWAVPLWEDGGFSSHLHWPLNSVQPRVSSHLATWDAVHYLKLALEGYTKGSPSDAFYPLWPALIRAGAFLTAGNVFASGLLLGNLISLAGFVLFYRLVERHHGRAAAGLALAFLLAFPGAVFFQFIYTESLFMLLVTVFLTLLLQGRYRAAACVGFLLPLSKAIGIFCLVPLAWELWSRRQPGRRYAWLALPVAGYLAYFGVLWAFTGNPFEGYQAQRFYPNKPSIGNIFDIAGSVRAFLDVQSFHGARTSLLDRGFFVVFVAALPAIWRLNHTYFWYALFAGGVPGLATWFFSYSRNIMMCLPLFIVLGVRLQGPEKRWLRWYYLLLLGGLQVFFLVRYVNFMWAG
jgi:hypothetical protein